MWRKGRRPAAFGGGGGAAGCRSPKGEELLPCPPP
ncbi:unnamed protein product [Rhodiola kirilowii]